LTFVFVSFVLEHNRLKVVDISV